MAAYYFTNNGNDIFKLVPIVSNVNLQFLNNFMNGGGTSITYGNETFSSVSGAFIINEVFFQHKDTIQYFLTFDDLITYFYFGKGLGSMTIAGSIIADCQGNWSLLNNFMAYLGSLRGKQIGNVNNGTEILNNTGSLIIGGIAFVGVLSSFSVKSSAEPNALNVVDFTLNLDIIDSSFVKPVTAGVCY